jgi:hypothetical protein
MLDSWITADWSWLLQIAANIMTKAAAAASTAAGGAEHPPEEQGAMAKRVT